MSIQKDVPLLHREPYRYSVSKLLGYIILYCGSLVSLSKIFIAIL